MKQVKRKATNQEVFDELETIIKRAKKEELDGKELQLLQTKIDHHLLSVARKIGADWAIFRFGFFIEPVSDSRDVLEYEVSKSQARSMMIIDYNFDEVKISGDRPSVEQKDKVYLVQSLTYIISNFGRLADNANPFKDDMLAKAVIAFIE